jgi:hypothetical protein
MFFGTENMYANISKRDAVNIINSTLENNPEINTDIRNEILRILKWAMEQNDLQLVQQHYKPTYGLAMGAQNVTDINRNMYSTWHTY